MTSDKPKGDRDTAPPRESGPAAKGKAGKPEWADGLRKLYDSVVDEPLPDNFKDLLDKLDDDPSESGQG